MIYRHCKVYKRSDKERGAVGYIDIESDSPLTVYADFAYGNALSEDATYNVVSTTPFNWSSGKYNLVVPEIGDYKVTGYVMTAENEGHFKRRYRYTLTLQG